MSVPTSHTRPGRSRSCRRFRYPHVGRGCLTPGQPPIKDYGFVGDCRTAALVSGGGRGEAGMKEWSDALREKKSALLDQGVTIAQNNRVGMSVRRRDVSSRTRPEPGQTSHVVAALLVRTKELPADRGRGGGSCSRARRLAPMTAMDRAADTTPSWAAATITGRSAGSTAGDTACRAVPRPASLSLCGR